LNARTIEIDMKNFAFVPATITLQRGVPYRLRFVNTAGGGHNFVAKAFFEQATIDPASRSTINKGEVDLGGGESGDVRLVVNRIGTYDVHCSHFMHSIFGMKGKIVVR
jgi:plastocyanin